MALTHTAVTNAKSKNKIYKLFDGGGLYLQVKPSGYKCWKYDFRLNRTRGSYTIGQYPDISLKQARVSHRKAREYIAQGIHPKEIKEEIRIQNDLNNKRFSYYANQWLDNQNLAESTRSDIKQRIKKNLTPYLDKKNVNEFSTADLLRIMLRITDRGAKETAKKLANILRRIYNDILILGIVENNPAQELAELLPKVDSRNKGNFAHITTSNEIKVLLQQIDKPSVRQDFAVTQALKLMPLVFLRPGNIRFLKWEYIDFEMSIINIPESKMKKRKSLDVPLSHQAISILKEMEPSTGSGDYVFVSCRSKNGKPISENTTTKALQRIKNPDTKKEFGVGYMTSHGFRHTASTLLNEMGFNPDIIELQLAHVSQDRIRSTYNKAQWMEKRVEMMQAWADYLDGLKSGADVVAINTNIPAKEAG